MLALVLVLAKWLGLLGMITTAVLGIWMGQFTSAFNHYLMGLTSTFVYAAAQTMIIYYFIGMSRAIINATRKHDLDEQHAHQAVGLKKSVSRRGYLALLFATAALICGGGTLFGQLPSWIHWVLGSITIALGIVTGVREWSVFRLNAALYDRVAAILQASKTDAQPSP